VSMRMGGYDVETCAWCNGKGKVSALERCTVCHGKGQLMVAERFKM
jgi:DnaJ-class molecular chaperone